MLDSCRVLESEGFDVTYLPVGKNGIINLEVGLSLSLSTHTLVCFL